MELDMDEKLEKVKVAKIVNDLNKSAEKKAIKRENLLLTFIINATAREQDQHCLISKLQREINKATETVSSLQIENEIKDGLLKLKDEELESLKNENSQLQNLLQQSKIKQVPIIKEEKYSPIYNNNNNEVISTCKNITVSPTINEIVTTSEAFISSSDIKVDSTTPTTKKKRPLKRGRDVHVSNFIHNLRKRSKVQ